MMMSEINDAAEASWRLRASCHGARLYPPPHGAASPGVGDRGRWLLGRSRLPTRPAVLPRGGGAARCWGGELGTAGGCSASQGLQLTLHLQGGSCPPSPGPQRLIPARLLPHRCRLGGASTRPHDERGASAAIFSPWCFSPPYRLCRAELSPVPLAWGAVSAPWVRCHRPPHGCGVTPNSLLMTRGLI